MPFNMLPVGPYVLGRRHPPVPDGRPAVGFVLVINLKRLINVWRIGIELDTADHKVFL